MMADKDKFKSKVDNDTKILFQIWFDLNQLVSNLLPISEQILYLSYSPSCSASEFFWINAKLHTASDATHGSTCCCPTHEMWELPTPLIVANRSQQGDEVRELPARLNSILTTQGRCLRTPHQLQANVRKQYPNEESQQEESNATTLTSIGAVYRRKSEKIRSHNRSHSTPKQISSNSNYVAQVHYRNWTRHPLLRSESLVPMKSEPKTASLSNTQISLKSEDQRCSLLSLAR
ncbi:dynamin-related protein 4C-like [Dorcoceras hygrometricum]|uniref:Dynamin-related protein 4C-like n=1 Tax=Dorcoceras hygrometricum TaxID=472368 RepID=A0A2Z7AG74_9LAMI|nr:dynamin-related protein 4C-like [Dorcoceras hygrometricum]